MTDPTYRLMTDEVVDVAIVGAGVSGLAAAYELRKRKRSVVVLEREQRPGGIIVTERVGEFVIDAGPDALLVQKPAAVALCNELGLGDRLIPTKLPRTAFVLRDGELHPLPGASILGFPDAAQTALQEHAVRTAGKFSDGGGARHSTGAAIATMNRSQASCGAGSGPRPSPTSPSRCSQASMPATSSGSRCARCFRGWSRPKPERAASSGRFGASLARSTPMASSDRFRTGLRSSIDGLMNAVPKESVRCGSNVTRIDEGDGFTIHIAGKPSIRARAVILAIPAFAAAELLRPLDADLSAACGLDSLSLDRDGRLRVSARCGSARSERHRLRGAAGRGHQHHGRRVDLVEVAAARAEGQALLRAFLGGARDPDVLSRTDTELTNAALGDLTKILGIRGLPIVTRVYRWNRSSPQQEVGHGDLMQRIDARLAAHPGLFVSAAGFRGVGIPDCIARCASHGGHGGGVCAIVIAMSRRKTRAAEFSSRMRHMKRTRSRFRASLLALPCVSLAQNVPPHVEALLKQIKAADKDQLAVSEEDGRFLRLLVVTRGAKRALEIGAASGYSAIWMGLGMRETGGKR